jgi:hypothetical protein
MPVTITCTKKDGMTISAQATGDSNISFSLLVVKQNGLAVTLPPVNVSSNNGVYTATWSLPYDGTSYEVTATGGSGRVGSSDTQPVPFGNCS